MKKIISNLIKKYIVPIKYLFSSGISFVLDQTIFGLLVMLFSNNIFIIFFKLLARFVSSFINFLLNSKLVFKNKGKNAIIKYYILVIVQAIISSVSIFLLKILLYSIPTILISICVDVVIFIINYFAQKELIFK